MNNILDIINSIRESFNGSKTVYTQGSCYHFFKILKTIYPNAEAFYEKDHVVTKIDNKFYDITGQVFGNFVPFEEIDKKTKELIKNNKFGISGYVECPNCYDVFTVNE